MIDILLADDHQIVREGLKALLENQTDLRVIAEARDGREAVHLVQQLSPDLAILDIGMPELSGIEATKLIKETTQTKVIALSMHADRRFVVEMLKAGAMGYMLKEAAFEELTIAVRTVVGNQLYLSPRIADLVVKDYLQHLSKNEASTLALLTSRERQALRLMADGKNTKQIASAMEISVKTVETYRTQIMEKLEIHSIAELTKFAIREGLTTLDS